MDLGERIMNVNLSMALKNGLRNYATRYRFNLVLKICITIFFITWLIVLCVSEPFEVQIFSKSYWAGTGDLIESHESTHSNFIPEMIGEYWYYESSKIAPLRYVPVILVICTSIMFIPFLWLNRPYATIASSIFSVIVTFLLDYRMIGCDTSWLHHYESYSIKYYNNYHTTCSQEIYTSLWLSTLLMVGLSITVAVLSLMDKKKEQMPVYYHQPQSLSQQFQSPVTPTSPYDQLRQYKQLLDEGVITEADLEQKKQQLLQ